MGSSMSRALSMEQVPNDALGEVLLRVPAHPATLARASLACKGLHGFIGGTEFRRSFQAHHKSTPPPLLGFFHDDQSLPHNFLPIGDSPDRVSAAAFDPNEGEDIGWCVVDSRHGRVLLRSPDRDRFLVWDPAAGRRWYIDVPLAMQQHANRFGFRFNNAAVVCAAPAPAPAHSDCHDCPFSVVFVSAPGEGAAVVYLYSSKLGLWNEVASADFSGWTRISDRPVALVRNVLYWTMVDQIDELQQNILAFDLQTHRLYLIEQPAYIFDAAQENVQVMEREDGLLGLIVACGWCLQFWVLHEYNGYGTEEEEGLFGFSLPAGNNSGPRQPSQASDFVSLGLDAAIWQASPGQGAIQTGPRARWMMTKEFELDDLAVGPPIDDPTEEPYDMIWILSVEGSRAVFVRTAAGIFEVDLCTYGVPNRRICDAYDIQAFYPYKSFYYRGTGDTRDGANGQN